MRTDRAETFRRDKANFARRIPSGQPDTSSVMQVSAWCQNARYYVARSTFYRQTLEHPMTDHNFSAKPIAILLSGTVCYYRCLPS